MVVAALGAFLLAIPPHTAHAICRVVESGSATPVAFDPTTSALYVLAPDAIIGWECPSGPPPDLDAGPADTGEPLDAAVGEPLDAGVPDAGAVDDDGTPLCEGGERATPVRASVVSLVVQPRLLSGGGSSALIMPVPAHPQVVAATPEIFAHVHSASGNLVHERVEVIEDRSLGFQCTDPHYSAEAEPVSEPGMVIAEVAATVLLSPLGLLGCSAESSYYASDIGPVTTGTWTRDGGTGGSVIYEEIPTTDDYEVTVLSATDGAVLSAWLDAHDFPHTAIDDEVFASYVGEDHWFVALEVTPEPGAGPRDLAPIVVSWLGTEIPVTHRLQYDPDGGVLVTDTWVLAPDRMDASDESAITESADPLLLVPRTLSGFGLRSGWLTHLRISRNQRDEVEDAELVPTANERLGGMLERSTRVRIPLACCPSGAIAGPARTHHYERTVPVNEAAALPEAWLRSSYAASDAVCSSYGGGSSGSSAGCGGSGTASSGRPLRGCAVPSRSGGAFFAWMPIALSVLWLLGRGRRR